MSPPLSPSFPKDRDSEAFTNQNKDGDQQQKGRSTPTTNGLGFENDLIYEVWCGYTLIRRFFVGPSNFTWPSINEKIV